MKVKFLKLFVFVLFFNSAFSQDGFLIDKKGNKINVDKSNVKLFYSSDRLEYRQPGSDKEFHIDVSDITSADLGDYRIEIYEIDKKPRPYFIIAEAPNKKLIGYNEYHTFHYTNGVGNDRTSSSVDYHYYVIDASNNLIEKIEYNSLPSDKALKKREEAEAIVKKHFSDCPAFVRRAGAIHDNLARLADMPSMPKRLQKMGKKVEGQEIALLTAFVNPFYSKCDEIPASQTITTSENNAQTQAPTNDSQYNGTYQFESFSMTKPFPIDKKMAGTITIKDGFVDMVSKGFSTKFKILNIRDGIIYLQDKSMEHAMTITPETGNKKGAGYDTKIHIAYDKAMGSEGDYWCTKK